MNKDFDIPKGLSREGRSAAAAIKKFAARKFGAETSGGGCRAFYTPKEWRERGEDYGGNAELVVVHDGGDLAPCFNWDYCEYKLREAMDKVVRETVPGMWVEQCTSWYSAIYKEDA